MRIPTQQRQDLALLSLLGLSVGDAFGEQFFDPRSGAWLSERQAPPGPWKYTDDTAMTLSVVEQLLRHGKIHCDDLARAFGQRYAAEPHRGYGAGAHEVLEKIYAGVDWQSAARGLFDGRGSFGNGGAMRAAPIGAWFFEDLDRTASEARRSALVTHTHREGQEGAVAVAVAAAVCARGSAQGVESSWDEVFESVLQRLSSGRVRKNVEQAASMQHAESADAVAKLGNGSRIAAHDTVGIALWLAATHSGDYSSALWGAAACGGDVDTVCAIVGGIVVLSAGQSSVPAAWVAAREELPLLSA